MTCFLRDHDWGWPMAEGKRLRDGTFMRTGPDYQVCVTCAATRESPVQFEGKREQKEREELEWLAT